MTATPPPPTVGLLFSTLQRNGRLTLPVDNLREVIFDRDHFESPLEELRQVAVGAIGSVTIRDSGGIITIAEWRRGKGTTSDAQLLGQKLGDRRRMLGYSTGRMGQLCRLGGERVKAIEEARADLATHHKSASSDDYVYVYKDCLRQLEVGIPPERIRCLMWKYLDRRR